MKVETLKKQLLLLAWILSQSSLHAQPKPVASFSFNRNTALDEITGHKPKLVNVTPTKDRFGNENSAIFIHGNEYTYVNLGNYPELKLPVASISFWFCLEGVVLAGRGIYLAPVIITKNGPGDDFYESYVLYYHLKAKKMLAITSLDSISQPLLSSRDTVQQLKWYHAVLQYTDTSLSLFLNGVRQGNMKKNFRTRFLATDSVMLGHSANQKNLRFFLGAVDDVQFFDRILTEEQIMELYNAPDPNRQTVRLKLALYTIGIVSILILLYFFIKHRINLAVQREHNRTRNEQLILEYKLIALRAQINPHFISNCLSAIQHLIKSNKTKEATTYVAKFGLLVRQILDFSTRAVITLQEELDLLNVYLDLEQLRFNDRFDYVLEIDKQVMPDKICLPPLILNPIVENAIWHGLLPVESKRRGCLSVRIVQNANTLVISVEDNGIGINKDQLALKKQSSRSYGHDITEQRLLNLNYLYKSSEAKMICENLKDQNDGSQGTRITIFLPIILTSEYESYQSHSR